MAGTSKALWATLNCTHFRFYSGGVRTTIALHCGWNISNMAAKAWLFGEFFFACFTSVGSYIAIYFTQISS